MPPAARIAPHKCSKREPFSATKVRQTIRSFTPREQVRGGNLARGVDLQSDRRTRIQREQAERFAAARRAAGLVTWVAPRSAMLAVGYLRDLGVAPPPVPVVAQGPLQELLADYRRYLSIERGLSDHTVFDAYEPAARRFLTTGADTDSVGLDRLCATEVREGFIDFLEQTGAERITTELALGRGNSRTRTRTTGGSGSRSRVGSRGISRTRPRRRTGCISSISSVVGSSARGLVPGSWTATIMLSASTRETLPTKHIRPPRAPPQHNRGRDIQRIMWNST